MSSIVKLSGIIGRLTKRVDCRICHTIRVTTIPKYECFNTLGSRYGKERAMGACIDLTPRRFLSHKAPDPTQLNNDTNEVPEINAPDNEDLDATQSNQDTKEEPNINSPENEELDEANKDTNEVPDTNAPDNEDLDPTQSNKDQEETHEEKIKKLQSKIKDLRDQILRSLAEQENIRQQSKRDVVTARSFALKSFVKSILETSDNLTRALEAVPTNHCSGTEEQSVLSTLYEGIKMTDTDLMKAFTKVGLDKMGAVGDEFDPFCHDVLVEYPDPEKPDGTVGKVMNVGFRFEKSVIRQAQVGIVDNTLSEERWCKPRRNRREENTGQDDKQEDR